MSTKNYSSNPSKSQTRPKPTPLQQQYSSNQSTVSTKDDIQEIKRKAQEANLKMQRRKRAAVKIQKVVRGFLARNRFEKML
jgi:hypothetical protein